jgi:tetratricopeptide (TPR) repeat protein
MSAVCHDLHLFADGQLDPAQHQRFEAHLADCHECARGLEEIVVLGALADQLRDDEARQAVAEPPPRPVPLQHPWWQGQRWLQSAVAVVRRPTTWVAAGAAAVLLLFVVELLRHPSPAALLVADLQARPYRATEARLAAPPFSGYRPMSGERGDEARVIDAMTTQRQQGLAALESRHQYHLLGVVYLLGRQYGRAEQTLAAATQSAEGAQRAESAQSAQSADLWNDRAALAYQQGDAKEALARAERALALAPSHGPALWNRALALEALGRIDEAARAFEVCVARNEVGWSGEARLRASVLRARRSAPEVPRGRP